jgi:hypothetical protein
MTGGGRLRLAARADEGFAVIEISDTGTGIPPEHLSKILDPFYTTKEKGTGLGLSVVYGIVERHGGTLEIDSVVGKGTTVRIKLPVAGSPTAGAALPTGWTDVVRRPVLEPRETAATAGVGAGRGDEDGQGGTARAAGPVPDGRR